MKDKCNGPGAMALLLTPRLWKTHFAASPLRSDLYSIGKERAITPLA